VCSFVCCVSFDRGVILCDVCYLFVMSYCKPLPPGKNPFAVNKYYITYLTRPRFWGFEITAEENKWTLEGGSSRIREEPS
jgi:hypothetical protein